MDRTIDFIKNFEPSVLGWNTLDIWIGLGIIILIFILANWLTSFLEPAKSQKFRKILNVVFYLVFGGVLILVILNSLLTERYDRLTVMLFLAILPYLKLWVGTFYKRYDEFVDKILNR